MVKKNFFFYSAIIIVVLDVITKLIISYYKPEIKILPFFSITYIQNTGAGFGIFQGYQIILILVSIIALVLIARYFKDIPDKVNLSIAFGMITGGIIGNLLDRVFRNYVVDFLDFFIKSYHWPAFNIADSALVVGAVILIWHYVFMEGKEKKK